MTPQFLDDLVQRLSARARVRVQRLRREHPDDDRRALAERLVRSDARRAGVGGAVTGTLALVSLPVGLPAGVALTLGIEAGLLLALLELYGLDTEGERGRLRLYALWAGGGIADAAKSAGLKVGADVAARALAGSLPVRLIGKLHPVLVKLILRRLGLGWLPRALKFWPVLGAPVGYVLDSAAVRALGRAAIGTLEQMDEQQRASRAPRTRAPAKPPASKPAAAGRAAPKPGAAKAKPLARPAAKRGA